MKVALLTMFNGLNSTYSLERDYVAMVVVFNYVDYGTNNFYGIETKERVHKLSYRALAEASN